jgi:CheY-like chemotaxis protein
MREPATPTVIVVGENSEFAYLMQRYVSQGGYQVFVVEPNPGTVDVARQRTPIAILIDVESPQAKGWDILRTLKADLTTQDIPVLICSWLDEELRSLEEGAAAYLRKPVMYDDLHAALTDASAQVSSA